MCEIMFKVHFISTCPCWEISSPETLWNTLPLQEHLMQVSALAKGVTHSAISTNLLHFSAILCQVEWVSSHCALNHFSFVCIFEQNCLPNEYMYLLVSFRLHMQLLSAVLISLCTAHKAIILMNPSMTCGCDAFKANPNMQPLFKCFIHMA